MESKRITQFMDLKAWQESHKVVISIYKMTESFPSSEQFGLTSQMRRSAISITSNIAEAFGRWSKKEKDQFFSFAAGSCYELQNQLIASKDIGFISEKFYEEITDTLTLALKLLFGLRRANSQTKSQSSGSGKRLRSKTQGLRSKV